MRVTFFLDCFANAEAGTEGQFLLLLRQLLARGIACGVYTLRGYGCLERLAPGAMVRDLGVTKMSSPAGLLAIARTLRNERRLGSRVVQTFLNDVSILVPPLSKFAGMGCVVGRRDLGFWHTPATVAALKLARHFVGAYVVNCEAVADVVSQVEGVARHRIITVTNALAKEPSHDTRAQARARLGLSSTRVVVACVANLKPLKRQDLAISALARITGDVDVELLLAGEDTAGVSSNSYLGELTGLATQLGVADRVRFLGAVADTATVWAAADAGLLVSDTEGLSNSVIEALSNGVPMICTDVGGNRELLEGGRFGHLVRANDVESLTRALRAVACDADYRARVGEDARSFALQHFSVDRMVDAYLDVYRSVG